MSAVRAPRALEKGVCRDGRPVEDDSDAFARDPRLFEPPVQRAKNPLGRIWIGGEDLRVMDFPALLVEQDKVGKRTSHVDTDSMRRQLRTPCLS